MATHCIFCDIGSRKTETKLLFEDDEIVVFNDIKPAAKFHFLAIPKKHIKDGKSLLVEHRDLIEKLVAVGKRVIAESGGDINDLRLGFHWPPFNSIPHLHLHLISPASEMSFLSRMIFKPDSYWFLTPEYVLQHKLQQKL